MNVLEIHHLTKKFGDFVAVDNISLSIEEGEIFGLLGANGAGKSTTIHMISSLLRSNEGEITILGKNIAKHRKFAKMNIGIVPQDLAIYEDLTAYANVKFFAGLYGLRGAHLHNRVEEALQFVGLSDKHKSFPKNFSGGMKRRLNIACAIAHRPKLIIMDEPTVGIDPHSRNYILESVKKLNAMGCTIIYTSHYMEEVEEICTRIAIVDHGKIIAEGTKEQLKSIITNTKDIQVVLKSAENIDIGELKTISGVEAAVLEDNTIKINSDAGVNNLNQIIEKLMKNGAEIRSLEEKAPNLETVFLTLTGRQLRD
ncbi:ABC transporter ATP-binding protein [Bacillus licheniformis]|uniref:ABC transporter YfiL n=1 Tax=Bacillus licheniformis (strain ATCC 14580 / DSM 13 / JCM 2505 / CCUG 7422 / NBRC 12200 / NCIMB 9375 / NCTC 10341 / NRRL NRS-1264 / Gibson 46) TaxID=279010 RepID=Q65DP6_BACLD|nr:MULTISPECIES: ABC transporter ATP-binding protein [Bacillus]MBY8348372.1 ABC transporter ATP-binding protein [Bacillus sp. PCH94]MDP4137860.1 ABC transporter ATP-binding protein [Bacillota bacterium]AAU25442.1 ABC transporter YfiL [Bacillus licheniformis DSM 13 = ATCC 14580]AAU42818.1 putative antimicrobial peptide ABC exporter ATP-binding protein [Bacillus licheniformis DSM 13 = ATCC 14580]AKQ75276.1 ABC transporter [Bacillus licheniformis WX-02]